MSANSLDFTCDWQSGFNLSSNFKGPVGYLLSWSGCGGLNLKKDIKVWSPIDDDSLGIVKKEQVECAGLVGSLRYEGGENDPIRLVTYVSKDMAAEIRSRLARPLTNTKLKLEWLLVDFDLDKKQWYESAFVRNKKKAEANVDSEKGELQIFIDKESTKIHESLDLRVYKFEFQLVPADGKTSELEFATGPSQRIVKKWSGG